MVAEQVLLFVCHANVCRSPMAERLSRAALGQRPALRSSRLAAASAGTHARSGAPMHGPAAEVLVRLGAEPEGFHSRALDRSLITLSTVVLTATRRERAAVVTTVPSAVRRTFTLREFARLTAAVDPLDLTAIPADERLTALLAHLPRMRPSHLAVTATDDDLPDPVNGTVADVWTCAREIERCLEALWAIIEQR